MSVLSRILSGYKIEPEPKPRIISENRAHLLWLAMNRDPRAMPWVSLADVADLEHGETFDMFLLYNKDRIVLDEEVAE